MKKETVLKYLIILPIIFIGIFVINGKTQGAVIFETNFDNTPDWNSAESQRGGNPGDITDLSAQGKQPPLGFSNYRSLGGLLSSLGKPLFQVVNTYKRGLIGKSLLGNYEVINNVSGGGIGKWLGQTGYDELYIRFYRMFENGYKYGTKAPTTVITKLFRIMSNVDDPQTTTAQYDPMDMQQLVSTRPEWNDYNYDQPWGGYAIIKPADGKNINNHSLTLAADISSTATSLSVADDLTNIDNPPGTLKIGNELISYGAINRTTKTFSGLVRGKGGTIAQAAVAGSAVIQNQWGFNNSNNGGKQAYVILQDVHSGTDVNWTEIALNPEGHRGSIGDPVLPFATISNNNLWRNWYGKLVFGNPGDFPWSVGDSLGQDYQGNGEWVMNEIHIKMNDIGQANGVFEYWLKKETDNAPTLIGGLYNLEIRKNILTKFNYLILPDNMQNSVYNRAPYKFTLASPITNTDTSLQVNEIIDTLKITQTGQLAFSSPTEYINYSSYDAATKTFSGLTRGAMPNYPAAGHALNSAISQLPPPSQGGEQTFGLDDLVIYTPLIAQDSLWASSPQDGRLPLNYAIGLSVPDTTAPTTSITPIVGQYTSAQTITLQCLDNQSGCNKIYYTLDGSIPSISSAIYTSPIQINSTTTIKFFSIDNANNIEPYQTKIYSINMAYRLSDFLKLSLDWLKAVISVVDLNSDGVVNAKDLGIMMSKWGN